jgi:hypothetical protein
MIGATSGLTEKELAAVEAYRKRLAKRFPDVRITSVRVTEGVVEVRLSDEAYKDMQTLRATAKLANRVEENYQGVYLVPTPAVAPLDE